MRDDKGTSPGWGTFLDCVGLGDADGVDLAWGNALRVLHDEGGWRNSAHRAAILAAVISEVRGTHTGVDLHVRMHGASLAEYERTTRREDARVNGRRPTDHPSVVARLRAHEAGAQADRGSYLMGRIQAAECVRSVLALGVSPDAVATELLRLVTRWRAYHARAAKP